MFSKKAVGICTLLLVLLCSVLAGQIKQEKPNINTTNEVVDSLVIASVVCPDNEKCKVALNMESFFLELDNGVLYLVPKNKNVSAIMDQYRTQKPGDVDGE